MAYTTINKSTSYFDTSTWTATTNAISNLNFSPDWVWIKSTDTTNGHVLFDTIRGANKRLSSASDGAESTVTDELMSFDSNGYTLGSSGNTNDTSPSNASYVGWSWRGSDSSASSNSDGSITSTVSANTTAGFSIVSWTGNGTNDATIGHGLGEVPKMIIVKNTADVVNWRLYHQNLSTNRILFLNNNQSEKSPSEQGNGYIKTVGSSTFSTYAGNINDEGVNGNGDTMIAYCFAEKTGYSKFGSYTGNGNADGPFIYTGFKPAFILGKVSSDINDWWIFNNKRPGRNTTNQALLANLNNAESTDHNIDILSNGFKIKDNDGTINANNNTHIYIAFGQSLVGSNNVPCTAR